LPVVFGAKVTVIGSTDPNLLDIIYSQSEFDDDTGKYETSVEAELFAVNQVIGSPQLCDISSLQDFTDLQGKVALIEKATQCDFDIQINNAFALGAVAALIYNNDEGGNLRVTMTGMPVNIPAGFLPRQDGIDLLIYSGQVVMISSWGNANVYIDPYQ